MNQRNGWFFLLASVLSILGIIGIVTRSYQTVLSLEVSESVENGYKIWQQFRCEECHTLYGQGGGYAPDLTHVYALRSQSYLRDFFVSPAAYYPDHQLMPRFALRQDEVTDLLAMFRWVDEEPLASRYWPPRLLAISQNEPKLEHFAIRSNRSEIESGRQIFGQRCASCHSMEPAITIIGPSLWNIQKTASERLPGVEAAEYIRMSIIAPSDFVVEGFQDVMQKNFGDVLSSTEINELVAFLMTIGFNEQGGD